jgi:hypothetical protein
MRKTCLLTAIFILLFQALPAQGIEQLAQSASGFLSTFFKDKFDARAAVVQIENLTDLSDLAIQKVYQLIFARMEGEKNIQFLDLLIDFTENKGNFNLSKADQLNYLVDLKFIRNKNKIGMGIVVFSKRIDRMAGFKYVEQEISKGEREMLDTRQFGFSELGFSKKMELDIKTDLLDIQEIQGTDGRFEYFFFYPDEIIGYEVQDQRLNKHTSIKLQWPRPFYPTQENEGKLLLFAEGTAFFMTAGSNFAAEAKLFQLQNDAWRETDHIPFVPLKLLQINGQTYLAGGQYELGRNYFGEKVLFMPLVKSALDKGNAYEKKIPAFFSIDFSLAGQQLQTVHLIDLNYQYHLLSADFNEITVPMARKGSSLAVLNDEWLAMSDYSQLNDRLFFFDIRNGGQRRVYENKIEGEIVFLRAGIWAGQRGFWVDIRSIKNGYSSCVLQFWGKSNG